MSFFGGERFEKAPITLSLHILTSSHLCAIKWRTLKINELNVEFSRPTQRRAAYAMSKMLELTLG